MIYLSLLPSLLCSVIILLPMLPSRGYLEQRSPLSQRPQHLSRQAQFELRWGRFRGFMPPVASSLVFGSGVACVVWHKTGLSIRSKGSVRSAVGCGRGVASVCGGMVLQRDFVGGVGVARKGIVASC
jgi:hypothetical protein